MDRINISNEKKHTIIIYIIIGILVIFIGMMICLKINYNNKYDKYYADNYISIEEIAGSLNVSHLANIYAEDDADFVAVVSDSGLIVTYIKDDTFVNLDVPLKRNKLVVTMDNNNEEIVTDIYKEIANIICMYYENAENNCRYTLDNIDTDNGISGIKFDNNKIYIDITKSIDVSSVEYNTVTKTDITDFNYTLNLLNNKISDIMVSVSHLNVTVMGTIERLTDVNSDLSVVVKLYDNNDELLEEKKYNFNENNPLEDIGTFLLMFEFSDTLDGEDIVSYSIEIVE